MKKYKSPVVCWKSKWVVKGYKQVKTDKGTEQLPNYVLEITEYNKENDYAKKVNS